MWKWLLQRVMNYVVGKDVFGQIQDLVANVATDSSISGSEKRDKVMAEAKEMGKDFASHMLNLAIEAAVALLKEKQK